MKPNDYVRKVQDSFDSPIFLASEVGSRAWGYNDSESDYDICIFLAPDPYREYNGWTGRSLSQWPESDDDIDIAMRGRLQRFGKELRHARIEPALPLLSPVKYVCSPEMHPVREEYKMLLQKDEQFRLRVADNFRSLVARIIYNSSLTASDCLTAFWAYLCAESLKNDGRLDVLSLPSLISNYPDKLEDIGYSESSVRELIINRQSKRDEAEGVEITSDLKGWSEERITRLGESKMNSKNPEQRKNVGEALVEAYKSIDTRNR